MLAIACTELLHLHHIFCFLINIDFRVRRNVLQRGDDFLFNGSKRGNFIKIPSANLDRGKNPSLVWVSLFRDNCPSFLGQPISGNGFIPTCNTEFAICISVHLIQWVLVFFFPFSLHLSPNRFLFWNFSSLFLFLSFLFFRFHYEETL